MKAMIGFVLIVAMLLSGCNAVQPSLSLVHQASLNAATDVFPSETTLTIRDQPSWQELWSQMTRNTSPAPPVPTVDFAKDMVLLAATGTRPTGGYAIAITDGTQSSSGITVNVTIRSPGASCIVTQALTSPVDIATTPRSEGNVAFNVKRAEQNC